MGIPGILSHIGKGERIALTKLAVEYFENNKRPLRIAIDAAIWNFQSQSGQGGKNPALRTFFYRLLRLLALPIHPVFVYDGKNKPLTKRGKTVSRYGTCLPNEMSKHLVTLFQYPHHTAPGEAEAECAFLQQNGVVDAVMSQDADAIMFGSTLTLRDWSKEGAKGNKSPTHVNVLKHDRIKEISGLDPDGMILVALLSGGDYHEGVPGFGPALACAIAKAGFGTDLLQLVRDNDEAGIDEWRERLRVEVQTNESGYLNMKYTKLDIPNSFPNRGVLEFYMNPVVSSSEKLTMLEERWLKIWDTDIEIEALRDYTRATLDWQYKTGAMKFMRCLAQPLFQHRIRRGQTTSASLTVDSIGRQRKHFESGGIPELQILVIPSQVVELDLDTEQDHPEFDELDDDTSEETTNFNFAEDNVSLNEQLSSSKNAVKVTWSPHLPDKWWVPKSILEVGLPEITGAWSDAQKEIELNPLKFATRKCPKPKQSNSKRQVNDPQQKKLEQYMNTGKAGSSKFHKLSEDTSRSLITLNPLSTSSLPPKPVSHQAKSSKSRSITTKSPMPTPNPSSTDELQLLPPSIEKVETKLQLRPTREARQRIPDSNVRSNSSVSIDTKIASEMSIKSFFGPPVHRELRAPIGALSVSECQQTNRKSAAVTSTASARHRSKKAVTSRESLPGAWKEMVTLTGQDMEVSYVDLTND